MDDPAPRGALLLAEHLKNTGANAYSFARRTGIPYDHVFKVLHGKRRRICIDLALDIEAATGGAVPVASWRMRAPALGVRDNRPCHKDTCAATLPSEAA